MIGSYQEILLTSHNFYCWIPAYAGMTEGGNNEESAEMTEGDTGVRKKARE